MVDEWGILKLKYLVMFWGILFQGLIDVFQFVPDALEFVVAGALKRPEMREWTTSNPQRQHDARGHHERLAARPPTVSFRRSSYRPPYSSAFA